jgi:hypothetical protein
MLLPNNLNIANLLLNNERAYNLESQFRIYTPEKSSHTLLSIRLAYIKYEIHVACFL